MDERTALERAIAANPEEDTPRLAYADWLDEHGGAEDRRRAEFIRVSIELNRLRPDAGPHDLDFWWGGGSRVPYRREWESAAVGVFKAGGWKRACYARFERGSIDGHRVRVRFRRGFVEAVEIRADHFIAFAGMACARFPLTLVNICDQAPHACTPDGALVQRSASEALGEPCCWARDTGGEYSGFNYHFLPPELYDALPAGGNGSRTVYSTRDDAFAALSAACLAFGRRQRDRVWAGEIPVDRPIAPSRRRVKRRTLQQGAAP
jgi:uncharacterized protein (TIGR02996 family)